MLQEAQPYEEQDWEAVPADEETNSRAPVASLPQALGFGATTMLGAGLLDLCAHLGPTGLVVGGIAAYVAAKHGPDLYAQVRAGLPALSPGASAWTGQRDEPDAPPPPVRSAHQRRSLLDRALGRFPQQTPEQQDEDMLLVPDEEDEEWADEAWNKRPAFPAPSAFSRQPMLDVIEGMPLALADLAGKAIFICGMRRHGKTTLGARLAEQFGRHYLPLLIPDLEGDYLSLWEVLPGAVIAAHPAARAQYEPFSCLFAGLDSAQAAYDLGYNILEQGYQVSLDQSSYATLDQGVAIQVNLIRGLFRWANTHPQGRVPCHVYLDEAQRYLPQTLADSAILDKALLGTLLQCYMDLIAIGGKRGLAPVILTQRMAQVNKKIMAQSEVFFLLRQTHDGDLERCMEYVSAEVATKADIARFRPGQGVYIAADGSQQVVSFKRRQSSGQRSATPTPEAAARYAQMPMARPGLPTPAAREDAREAAVPSPEYAPARVTTPPAPPAAAVRREPTLLERAIAAYRHGATSQARLAAALNISPWEARKLMPRVEAEVKHEQADAQS